MDGFDDAELAEAIARSLQESSISAKKRAAPEVIEIEDDDEEEQPPPNSSFEHEDDQFEAELKRAIEESKAQAAQAASIKSRASGSSSSTPASSSVQEATPPASTKPGSGFLFDRAQMERERLERQKRLRPDIVQAAEAGQGDDEEDDEEEADDTRSAKRQRVSASSSVPARANVVSSSTRTSNPVAGMSRAASGSDTGEGLYLDGELRQTANRYVEPARDTRPVFRLTDVLAPRSEITFAIVSAYVINLPWFYSFFNRETPVIVATQDAYGNETIREVLPNWIKVTPFLRNGRGCQHMKFMLLFYNTGRLRVVVSTANLIEYDWRDIENSVWVQDVPLRPVPVAHNPKANDFPAAFQRVLKAVNVVPALINMIQNGHDSLPLTRIEELGKKWDFSKVKVALIASLAGKHTGWPDVILTGHTGLMKALQDMKLRTPPNKELQLECQGSSIGTYTTQWTNEFYVSARGESAEKWLDQSKTKHGKLPYPPLKILFPTKTTVQQSVAGEPGGGTMFCRRQQWEAARFPRDHFYDSKSKRGNVLMHSKMIIGTFKDAATSSIRALDRFDTPSDAGMDDDDIVEVGPPSRGNAVGWAYVGSHNFTPSAWGTLSGSSFNPILNVLNFELGVLFPLRSQEELEKVACWERPPKKYVIGNDIPWIQSESPYFQD